MARRPSQDGNGPRRKLSDVPPPTLATNEAEEQRKRNAARVKELESRRKAYERRFGKLP